MKANARKIIQAAQQAIHDVAGDRWPAGKLVAYLNEGQRAVVLRRPDAAPLVEDFELAPGARQTLPDNAMLLVDVHRNTIGRQRAVTKVDRQTLEASAPTWLSQAPALEIRHFMHDLREPRVFHVYPPARAGARVEAQFAAYPEPVPEPSGPTAATVTGECALHEEWATALLHYVLARAYGEDSEAGALPLAVAHMDLFKRELGEPLETASAISAAA